MAQPLGNQLYQYVENGANLAGEFVEHHFAMVSFVASSIFMGMFSLPMLITGGGIGAALHYYYDPNLKIDPTVEKIITVVHATVAISGACACFVLSTAAASAAITPLPFLASLAVGSAAYRAYAAFFRN